MIARPTFSMQEAAKAVYSAYSSKDKAVTMCQHIAEEADRHQYETHRFVPDYRRDTFLDLETSLAEGEGITLTDIYNGMGQANARDTYILNVIMWLDRIRTEALRNG